MKIIILPSLKTTKNEFEYKSLLKEYGLLLEDEEEA